jgi:hypothetical protein
MTCMYAGLLAIFPDSDLANRHPYIVTTELLTNFPAPDKSGEKGSNLGTHTATPAAYDVLSLRNLSRHNQLCQEICRVEELTVPMNASRMGID